MSEEKVHSVLRGRSCQATIMLYKQRAYEEDKGGWLIAR